MADINEFKEQKIKLGECNVNYVKVGTGPHHILFMPGTFGFISHFTLQLKGFDREKFTMVAWDPPGFGKSQPPIRDFPINMYERDAEYAYEFMKALNIPKYSLLGWSGGGISSLILAATHPDVVHNMIVWGARSYILEHELEIFKIIRDFNNWSPKMREAKIEMYGEELAAHYSTSWVDGIFAIYNTRGGDICTHLLKDIQCPTLILHGGEDKLVDKVHPEFLLSNIKDARLHIYPNGGHIMQYKFADDINRRVQEFLLEKYN